MVSPTPESLVYLLEFVGEDDRFAAAEASVAGGPVRVAGPGVGVVANLDVDRAADLGYTRAINRTVGTTEATVDAAERLLAAAPSSEVGGSGPSRMEGDLSIAVRARDVRSTADVSTASAERRLGAVLDAAGYRVDLEDPDWELRALFAGNRCYLGWQVSSGASGFGQRAPSDRPFVQPGSMAPRLARALVNLALPGPVNRRRVLDPMSGTGGFVIEATLIGARSVGVDAQRRMALGARRNLRAFSPEAGADFLVGDASCLPVCTDGVDAVVVDVPYGRQSPIKTRRDEPLVPAALGDIRRVLRDGRAVVTAARSLSEDAESAGFQILQTFEQRVHRSLTRYVHVLE